MKKFETYGMLEVIIKRFILEGKNTINKIQIEELLYEMCEREHSSCNDDCIVFRLKEPSMDCRYHENGKAMYNFIKTFKETN